MSATPGPSMESTGAPVRQPGRRAASAPPLCYARRPMYHVDPREGRFPTLTLADDEAESAATLAPTRGGMILAWSVAGRDLLYLDRATFEDPAANVRGGVPVLFPSPGKLGGDTWSWGGVRGSMKQHGFARNLPWEVLATGTEEGAWATLRLASNEVTRAQYPWDFLTSYTYRLRGKTLAIEMQIENRSPTSMPFGVGFHPYFAVPDAEKAEVRIPTPATRAFDNRVKQEISFSGFDLTAKEVDLHLGDHGSSRASLVRRDAEITLQGSPELSRWVIWTLQGKDFVCLEPWSCPGDALNSGEGLLVLAPGETRAFSLLMTRTR
ncbi:MAG: galactose mutarotase [Minicystis sp.]